MVPQESIPKYELTYNCRIMTNSRLVRPRQMGGSKPAHRQKTPPPQILLKRTRKKKNKKTKKKRQSSDAEVGKLLNRWRIRNFLEPLVLCYKYTLIPISDRCVPSFLNRLISLALILLCFMTYPPTPKTIFLTARFTHFRAFSIALF